MADYQSLLTRAVANLPSTSSAATRQAIYDRARKALLTQLRTLRPPLPEGDIAREEKALNQAIALVEAKFGSAEGAQAEPSAAPTAPTASPADAAVERPNAGGPSFPSPRPSTAGQPSAPPPASAAPPQTTRPPASPVLPTRVSEPAAPRTPAPQEPLAARSPGQTQPRPALTRPPAPPSAPVAQRPAQEPPSGSVSPPEARAIQGADAKAPLVRAERAPRPGDNSGVAAPVVAARPDRSGSGPTNLAKVVPSAEAASAGSGAPPVVARTQDEAELGTAPEVPMDMDRLGTTPRPEPEGQRPHAPMAVAEKGRSWLWLALAVVLGVVLSVAGAAIVMRQKPQDLAIAPPEPQQEAPPPPAKIAQRAQPSPTEDKSTPPAANAPPTGPSAPEAATAPVDASNPAALPSAARAAMLIASPDNPQKPVVNLGSTVWSTISPKPGQPATVAVKAEADIPDLKMHATMTLRKNTDPTLEATHTIDLNFSFADGAPITGFKDVGAPQMRKVDSTASEALSSAKVKVSDVYFLIALSKGDQDATRNLDLMQTRAWFDYPLLLDDNRIAKLVFQKSSEGEAMLAKAFDAWK